MTSVQIVEVAATSTMPASRSDARRTLVATHEPRQGQGEQHVPGDVERVGGTRERDIGVRVVDDLAGGHGEDPEPEHVPGRSAGRHVPANTDDHGHERPGREGVVEQRLAIPGHAEIADGEDGPGDEPRGPCPARAIGAHTGERGQEGRSDHGLLGDMVDVSLRFGCRAHGASPTFGDRVGPPAHARRPLTRTDRMGRRSGVASTGPAARTPSIGGP